VQQQPNGPLLVIREPPDVIPAGKSERPDSTVCDAFLDTEHFRVHYATSGPHMAPGYPDLSVVRKLGAYLERAYRVEVDSLGLDPPLPDGTRGGGLDLIDCYFVNLSAADHTGYASWEVADPVRCPNGHQGFMEISTVTESTDFDRFLRLVSAHELFHLLQYAIDAEESSWLKESTAERAETIVWPDELALHGMVRWFNTPHWPLWSTDPVRRYDYHFWRFLETVLAPDIVPDVWRRCCQSDWRDALFDAIAAHGADFDSLLAEFAVWNVLTWCRDDGRHFPEGSHYLPIRLHAQHWHYPVLQAQLPDSLLPLPTGSDYIRFYGPASDNTLRVTLHGDPAVSPYRRVACVATHGSLNVVWTAAPDSAGNVTLDVPDWGLYDEVTLVVTSLTDSPTANDVLRYTYSAEEIGAAAPDAYRGRIVLCFPNPMRQAAAIRYAVPENAGRVDLDIYDLAGRLVRHLVTDHPYAGQHWQPWDGRNREGRPVGQGTYLVVLRWRGGRGTARLTVRR